MLTRLRLLFCNIVNESTIVTLAIFITFTNLTVNLVSKTQTCFICMVNQISKNRLFA